MLRLLATGLGRLSVGRKLLLIFMLDMTAVAFISGILVNEKYLSINFARKELAGNVYIDGIRTPLVAIASGSGAADESKVLTDYAQQLSAIEAAHGEGMGSAETSAAFVRALQDLAAAPDKPVLRHEALDRGRALVTRVGNLSNLILDPDLDSYYTMSILVLRAPELLAAVAGISDHINQLAHDGGARTEEARSRFLLLEGRLDAGREGLESDYGEAFAAASPALKANLDGSRAALLAAIERYRGAARAAMAPGAGAADFAGVAQAHQELLARLDTAWGAATVEMKRLLDVRIDGFFKRMWLHLGTALGLLAIILSAVFFVARQIAVPLRRLSAVTDKVRRTGDHSLRAQWDSRDEIGRLVLGFNDMLAQLDRERAVQQELAANARAAEAQQQLVEAIPFPLVVTAIPGHQVLHANGPAQAWLGSKIDDPWRAGLEPNVRARFFQQLADRDAVNEFEVRWNTGDETSWAVLSARRLEFQGQGAVLTAFAPINHLKQLERRLELWAKVFEASGEGIVIVDAQHHVLSANHAFCRSTLYESHEIVGAPLSCVDDGSPSPDFLNGLWTLAEKRSTWQGEVLVRRRDGSSYPAWMMLSAVRDTQQGVASHTIVTTIDISDRKRSEERIRFLAKHDVLTELPNRSLCAERLQAAMQQARRRGERAAVLFIDLDRFKNINDSLGHAVGDGLLRSVSRRLLDSVRVVDTVSRLGGDEFVVILNGVADVEEIAAIVERRLVPAVRNPHQFDGAELHVSCSVGIAVFPDDGADSDTLMRHADAAMYQAKAEGRNAVRFFTPELNERAQRRLQIESRLRHAAERGEFRLHYQPRIDARSGRTMGVEALLRWSSEELGEVSPAVFVPIAEEAALIVDMGEWVIDEACRQYARWLAEGHDVPQISINVSALQLRNGGLTDTLRAALERYALLPGAVEIELTESTLMDDVEHTLEQLHAIKRLGVELAIDDFGTGYSSLNYLNRFPIDRLKVDRSFVRDMLEDPTNLAITRAIIGLGHTLGMKVVAEGVETEREAQMLRSLNCDELQGYLFAKPLPAGEFLRWTDGRRLRLA